MAEVTYPSRKAALHAPVLPSWGKVARESIPSGPRWILVVLEDDGSHSMVIGRGVEVIQWYLRAQQPWARKKENLLDTAGMDGYTRARASKRGENG